MLVGACQLSVADRPSWALTTSSFCGALNGLPTVTVVSPMAPALSRAITLSVRPTGATACSRPELLMVSPAPPSTVQVTGKLWPSLRVALNCSLPPTGTEGLGGETVKKAPGGLAITKEGNVRCAICASSEA